MNHRFVVLMLGASFIFAACLLPSTNSSAALPSANGTLPNTCTLKQLSVSVASGGAAGGTEGMLIAFRNKGATTCYLQGYPKVVAARRGASLTATPSTNTYLAGLVPPNATPPLISLRPGNSASVAVVAGDEPPGRSSRCVHQRFKTVTVSLPSHTGSRKLSADLPRQATSLPSCSRVEVTPFVKGVTWGF
jgi:hypothetical protein